MIAPPFYRWKSFWIGVLALAFIGWASWDTKRNESLAYYGGTSRAGVVCRMDSGTHFIAGPAVHITGPGAGFYFRHGQAVTVSREWEKTWKERRGLGVHFLKVPDGPVFVMVLAGWLGFLAWRWRRIHLHLAGSPPDITSASPPESHHGGRRGW